MTCTSLLARGLLGLAVAFGPPLSSSTRCMATEHTVLQQLETRCEDGTRAITRFNRVLRSWDRQILTPKKPERFCRSDEQTFSPSLLTRCLS